MINIIATNHYFICNNIKQRKLLLNNINKLDLVLTIKPVKTADYSRDSSTDQLSTPFGCV